MTHEFKPGDRAMVVVGREDRGWFHIETNLPDNAGNVLVPPCSLHPLPTPDPLTELERRVVEAAIGWDASLLNNATHALLAARAPKDPLTIATDALRSIASCETHASGDVVDIARRAIASIEAREAK